MVKIAKKNKSNQDKIYGQNILLCNKKILVGEKYYAMLMTFFIFSLPYITSIIFFLKSGPLGLFQNIIYIMISSLLYIIHIYSMLKGGCTDPGILPRQLKDIYYETNRINLRYKISGHVHRINYCYSCYLFRPPRTSHCAVCDNCVERFDHHCLWLGTCIGKRNYKYFYILLGSLNISAILEIIFCIYAICLEAKRIKGGENNSYIFIIISGCILLYNILFVIAFIGKLFILHTYLVIKGLTFYEYTKEKMKLYPLGINPYDKYKLFSNKCILFRKIYKSNILYSVNNHEKTEKENEIHIIKYKSQKKMDKKGIIKFKNGKKEKEKSEKNSNNPIGKANYYLNTYQEYDSSGLKKEIIGNLIFKKLKKKKNTDYNNHVNSSKRTIGAITFDFNGILSDQKNKVKKNSSSESSKEIDFEHNKNVVINPYCIYIEKKKKQKNKNNNDNNKQDKNNIIGRNENGVESPFHEIEIKHKKIMFSNL